MWYQPGFLWYSVAHPRCLHGDIWCVGMMAVCRWPGNRGLLSTCHCVGPGFLHRDSGLSGKVFRNQGVAARFAYSDPGSLSASFPSYSDSDKPARLHATREFCCVLFCCSRNIAREGRENPENNPAKIQSRYHNMGFSVSQGDTCSPKDTFSDIRSRSCVTAPKLEAVHIATGE